MGRWARLWALLRQEGAMVLAMMRDPRAPKSAKLVALLAIAYVLSPVDFISDLVPVIGWLDDGVIAFLLLQLAFRFLPPDVHQALRARVQARSQSSRAGSQRFGAR